MLGSLERKRARSREYYHANRARLIEEHRKWRAANPGWFTEYSRKNAAKRLEQAKERRRRDPEKYRWKQIWQTWKLTPADFMAKLAAQNNKCAICGLENTPQKGGWLHVDHNHRTGEIRDLLCFDCNTFVGRLENDFTILPPAIHYLVKHKTLRLLNED